jgi:2-polyprenyl-3-methyl-5-hydroxy-6-metoxy-1,4-benzoquinol methylase
VTAKDYAEKPTTYFTHARVQITPVLPAHAARTLEIGCGEGSTLEWLKAEGRTDWVAGAELFHEAAAAAATRLDWARQADIEVEDLDIEPESIDLLLCLDVLEHTRDPWAVLDRMSSYVRPGGTAILSLPNLRHWSVIWPLLRYGKWEYAREGLMDRTHLRFFTRSSIEQLLRGAGYEVVKVHRPSLEEGRARLVNRLTGGLFSEFLTFQYIVSARKIGGAPRATVGARTGG